tara:strand:+ start:7 stop:342 length:336 start_codon:yes stop_codon:yes gene_type:complete
MTKMKLNTNNDIIKQNITFLKNQNFPKILSRITIRSVNDKAVSFLCLVVNSKTGEMQQLSKKRTMFGKDLVKVVISVDYNSLELSYVGSDSVSKEVNEIIESSCSEFKKFS